MSRRHNRITPPSADGWSNIIGKGRAPLRKPSELTKPQNTLTTSPTSDYALWHPTALKQLHTAKSTLTTSPLWQTLITLLTPTAATASIRTVVVLGLGSLHGPTQTSSFLQLALAVALAEMLAATMVMQDPAFSAADGRFLAEEIGAEVVVHPGAVERLGLGTSTETGALLFAPHLEYEVLQGALRGGARPRVMLANDLGAFVDMKRDAEKEFPEFVRCLREYDGTVLTDVDGSEDIGGGRAFNHTALYVRREATAEVKEVVQGGEETAGRKKRRRRRRGKGEVGTVEEIDVDAVVEGLNGIAL